MYFFKESFFKERCYLFPSRERGREGEREGEKHQEPPWDVNPGVAATQSEPLGFKVGPHGFGETTQFWGSLCYTA